MGCLFETAKQQRNQCGINTRDSNSNRPTQPVIKAPLSHKPSSRTHNTSDDNNPDIVIGKDNSPIEQLTSVDRAGNPASTERSTKTYTAEAAIDGYYSQRSLAHYCPLEWCNSTPTTNTIPYPSSYNKNRHTNPNTNISNFYSAAKCCRRQLTITATDTPHYEQRQHARVCLCNATMAARKMATAMAAVCTGRGGNIQEKLLQARDTLTTHLATASSSLIEHINYYAATAEPLSKRASKSHKHHRSHYPHPQSHVDAHALSHSQRRRHQRQHQHQTQHQRANCYSHCDHQHPQAQVVGSAPDYGCGATAAAYNYIGHNYYHMLRNSISFYAASSVILVLCYLTTTTSAAAANSEAAPLEKHPIAGIDWSKFDESSSDKEILDLLLEKKRYDKRLLPPVNGTLTVNVNVLLLSLASPDESSLKYEVEFLLNQQWNDPRLQYGNKSHYDFLNALHHHDSIWTPDTYFIMHGDFKDPIIPMHFALRIYRNGTITYAMRRHLILSCQGSLHIFPFDDPKCSFSMESISYEEAQIKYVWKNDEDTLRKSPSLTTLNAYLIKNQTTACDQNSWRGNYSCLRVDLIFTRDRAFYFTTVFIPGIILVTSSFITFWLEWNAVPARSMIGNYSCLQVELTFTRDRAYYFTTVFIPGIILVTSSFITFWLEWNAVPARVMIGVTTMLNFFTTSNGFRSTLPVVSNLTAMNVWDGVCMCFIYASLLEFVCVNYVGRKRPLHNVVYRPGENPVTQRLPAVLSRIGVILASPLEIIEREFHAALSSEKAAAGFSSAGVSYPTTPSATNEPPSTRIRWEQQHGGLIGAAVQNLRARSIRRKAASVRGKQLRTQSLNREGSASRTPQEAIYAEPVFVLDPPPAVFGSRAHATTVIMEQEEPPSGLESRRLSHASIATNTPPLILRSDNTRLDLHRELPSTSGAETRQRVNVEDAAHPMPVKPPRRKSSRSTSPVRVYETLELGGVSYADGIGASRITGEKRRDAGAPNEIVACTTCGGSSSPCTHSANNGCATERDLLVYWPLRYNEVADKRGVGYASFGMTEDSHLLVLFCSLVDPENLNLRISQKSNIKDEDLRLASFRCARRNRPTPYGWQKRSMSSRESHFQLLTQFS